jgi:hypothetical protein
MAGGKVKEKVRDVATMGPVPITTETVVRLPHHKPKRAKKAKRIVAAAVVAAKRTVRSFRLAVAAAAKRTVRSFRPAVAAAAKRYPARRKRSSRPRVAKRVTKQSQS